MKTPPKRVALNKMTQNPHCGETGDCSSLLLLYRQETPAQLKQVAISNHRSLFQDNLGPTFRLVIERLETRFRTHQGIRC